jgi:hypothetical protein
MKDDTEFKFIGQFVLNINTSILLAWRSKAWVCGHTLAANVGSNTTGGMDDCLL